MNTVTFSYYLEEYEPQISNASRLSYCNYLTSVEKYNKIDNLDTVHLDNIINDQEIYMSILQVAPKSELNFSTAYNAYIRYRQHLINNHNN